MNARIAIPVPSSDPEYNARSLAPYIQSLQSAGLEVSIIPLTERPDRVARLLSAVQGILLPGSRFDADPQRYGEQPIPACNPSDPARTAVDELLLQDAFNLRKPIFAICQGMQNLNVWRNGSLIQDLPTQGYTKVNHAPGRAVAEAHLIEIAPGSRLADLVPPGPQLVNSSHHQAVHAPGDNLRVAAVSPADGVIEAVELNSSSHFVIGVQWHPERTYSFSPLSRSLFSALARAAEAWRKSEPAAQHHTVSAR
jgi:putative glutamine amidotransferase